MATEAKGKKTRRSESQWRLLVAKHSSSGMGVEEFCRRQRISAASLYRWRKLLGEVSEGAEAGGERGAFVDLGTVNAATPAKASLELKLDLGDGLILHLVRH